VRTLAISTLRHNFHLIERSFTSQTSKTKKIGRPVILDMDMSPGDIVSLIYLLKAPIEVINLKVQLSGMA